MRKAPRNWLLTLALALIAGPAAWCQAPEPTPQPAPQEAEKTEAQKQEEAQKKAKDDTRLQVYDEIQVTSRASDMLGVADSASQGVTGHEDLERRPILRPGELLETVPGVIITQHSGGGKANQYFLRGFNLDHGTDFRVTVDDVPVNMPSHGHGQGYSDLNFLIPELVDTVRYEKGAYDASKGDFSAAGAADITYLNSLPKNIAEITPGTEGYGRLLAAGSKKVGEGDLLGAVEVGRNNGPWVRPDDYRKLNGVLRWNRGDAANGLTVTAMGYDGRWNSTDQIPERAVTEGLISRFGEIDPTDGGNSNRYSLTADWRQGREDSLTRASVYALRYGLDLFSNFTYFLDDPVNGDQFHQSDHRTVTGFQVEHQWVASWLGRQVETSMGLQARGDDIDNGLFHTKDRVLLSTTRKDDIRELITGPYAQANVRWTPWLRTETGLRADVWYADVHSDLDVNSGSRTASLLSPKLSVLLGPWSSTEFYLNGGYGFHSNDARGATIRVDPTTGEPVPQVTPLVRAKSVDVGVRTSAIPNFQTALTVFRLDLDSELVFSGDAGNTEAGRPSRRTGIELQNFYRPLRWLSIDADLALSKARFTDFDPVGDHIPGAIERAFSAGVSFDNLGNVFGSVRLRYFGPRPLVEDASVRSRSSSLVNTRLGYNFANGLSLALEVFNLLNETASDIDYFYESRLPGEPGPVSDVHFHPAEPRSARLVAQWRF
ncbi:MAG TPA: TonB-dependent receptor [Thermoanaerobaculia bacterium]|nr:TonB-dependent receptor [Thermoanaerobaculia bacterium]